MQPESVVAVTEEMVLAMVGRLYVENLVLHQERAKLKARLAELEDANSA